jgi:hypothetical protein
MHFSDLCQSPFAQRVITRKNKIFKKKRREKEKKKVKKKLSERLTKRNVERLMGCRGA